jgi:hypothetical protein
MRKISGSERLVIVVYPYLAVQSSYISQQDQKHLARQNTGCTSGLNCTDMRVCPPEIPAHIVAVPLKGQDSMCPQVECAMETNSFSETVRLAGNLRSEAYSVPY